MLFTSVSKQEIREVAQLMREEGILSMRLRTGEQMAEIVVAPALPSKGTRPRRKKARQQKE